MSGDALKSLYPFDLNSRELELLRLFHKHVRSSTHLLLHPSIREPQLRKTLDLYAPISDLEAIMCMVVNGNPSERAPLGDVLMTVKGIRWCSVEGGQKRLALFSKLLGCYLRTLNGHKGVQIKLYYGPNDLFIPMVNLPDPVLSRLAHFLNELGQSNKLENGWRVAESRLSPVDYYERSETPDEERVDLNQDSVDKLLLLPMFDLAKAEKLIHTRERYGCFRSMDEVAELLQLPPHQLERLRQCAFVSLHPGAEYRQRARIIDV